MAVNRAGRRHNDPRESKLPDTPASDAAIRDAFGWSQPTLARKRKTQGFPQADFYIERTAHTWWSRVVAWTQAQPKTSPIAGRTVGRGASESEAA